MSIWTDIWRLARYRFALYLLSGFAASTMFYLVPLVPGLVFQHIFDQLSANSAVTMGIWWLLGLLFATSVVQVLMLALAGFAERTVDAIARALMHRNLFAHILRYPGAQALPESPGEAVSRLRDDEVVVAHFLTWTLDPVGQCIMLIVALIVLLRINALITLVVVVPLLAALLVVQQARKRIQIYRKANQEAIGAVTGLLGEIFGVTMAVQIAGATDRVVAYLTGLNERRQRAAVRDAVLTQTLSAVTSNGANIGIGVMLLLAARAIKAGSFNIGDFVLFVSYLSWLTQMTGFFGNFMTQFRQVGVSLRRLHELLPDAPANALSQHAPTYLRGDLPAVPHHPKTAADRLDRLTTSGLSFHYADGGRGIDAIDLTLRRGTMTVVTGRIGSGKTTLLRVLLGLLSRDAGEVQWNGQPVTDLATYMTPPRVAYTAQAPVLFSEPLRANLLLGLPERDIDLTSALRPPCSSGISPCWSAAWKQKWVRAG